jgi:hypothetical protein
MSNRSVDFYKGWLRDTIQPWIDIRPVEEVMTALRLGTDVDVNYQGFESDLPPIDNLITKSYFLASLVVKGGWQIGTGFSVSNPAVTYVAVTVAPNYTVANFGSHVRGYVIGELDRVTQTITLAEHINVKPFAPSIRFEPESVFKRRQYQVARALLSIPLYRQDADSWFVKRGPMTLNLMNNLTPDD